MKVFYLFILFPAFLSASTAPQDLKQKIKDAARRSSLDHRLVEALIHVESSFKANAESPKGARGLMQVMPDTADICDIQEPFHAVNNLMGACDCLRSLINRYQGNLELALAAYNAGISNVEKYKGIPPFPETRAYVKKILKLYKNSIH